MTLSSNQNNFKKRLQESDNYCYDDCSCLCYNTGGISSSFSLWANYLPWKGRQGSSQQLRRHIGGCNEGLEANAAIRAAPAGRCVSLRCYYIFLQPCEGGHGMIHELGSTLFIVLRYATLSILKPPQLLRRYQLLQFSGLFNNVSLSCRMCRTAEFYPRDGD